ncbi:MAG TPA: hypothetical protein VF077_05690 [Nitrospiraceae bacterium]
MAFYELDQVVDYIADLLNANKVTIGLTAVVREERKLLLGQYPQCLVAPYKLMREGSDVGRNFRLEFQIYIYVIHANLKQTSAVRTKTDLQIARRVTTTLHGDMSLGGNIPGSWVAEEEPVFPEFKNVNTIATLLKWVGINKEVV